MRFGIITLTNSPGELCLLEFANFHPKFLAYNPRGQDHVCFDYSCIPST